MSLDPVTALLDVGSKVIDRLWPDPAQRDAAKLELFKMQQSGELAVLASDTALAEGQLKVNEAEATSGSLFVAGWRPAIGWICGAACAWNWIGLSIANIALSLAGHPLELAKADITDMLPVLMGMLGLGAMRTVETLRGKARKSL